MQAPPLSHAQLTRSLVQRGRRATLSTALEDGHPYGSLVLYAPDASGEPLLLLSTLAEHTHNLQRDPRVSLLVTDTLRPDTPLADGRAALVGTIDLAADLDESRARYLESHPDASLYIDFADFSLYRIHVSRARFIGGFGRMSWLTGDAYREATPDPLALAAPGIIEHMNEDHRDALLLYAQVFGALDKAEDATMTGVDALGYDLLAHTPDGVKRIRLPFESPVETPQAVRKALVQLVRQAREQVSS